MNCGGAGWVHEFQCPENPADTNSPLMLRKAVVYLYHLKQVKKYILFQKCIESDHKGLIIRRHHEGRSRCEVCVCVSVCVCVCVCVCMCMCVCMYTVHTIYGIYVIYGKF